MFSNADSSKNWVRMLLHACVCMCVSCFYRGRLISSDSRNSITLASSSCCGQLYFDKEVVYYCTLVCSLQSIPCTFLELGDFASANLIAFLGAGFRFLSSSVWWICVLLFVSVSIKLDPIKSNQFGHATCAFLRKVQLYHQTILTNTVKMFYRPRHLLT